MHAKVHLPLIMGIVNVTPDSFSDGSLYHAKDRAVAHALQLIDDGAAVVDIGGESTRPGADPVSVQQEMDRVLPVIEGVRQANTNVQISVDTRKAAVAAEAVRRGATMVNDVSAGRYDAEMFSTVAMAGVPYIIMHMLGEPGTMQENPVYGNVVDDVRAFLEERVSNARNAGIGDIMVDVGIGFGKTLDHNLELLRHLHVFNTLGCRQVLGISRKRFLGTITGIQQAADRDAATMFTHSMLLSTPIHMIRVHNAAMAKQMLNLYHRLH